MADYQAMWKDLGMDLETHDQLCAVLPMAFGDTYLTQENRPENMAFYDFVVSEIHGVRPAELIELQKQGGKVFGTFCVFVPDEVVVACGGAVTGLCGGSQFWVPEGEKVLPSGICPLIKASLGAHFGKTCPYFSVADMYVGETTCDGKKKAYEILGADKKTYVMDVPQMKREKDIAAWKDEIALFAKEVEAETGNELTAENLARAIRTINEKRRALARVFEARKVDPVPISGKDALLMMQIAFFDDPVRCAETANKLADELEARIERGEGVVPAGTKRILITGTPLAIPNWKLHHIVETSGAVVVCEEMCTGTRYFENEVDEGEGTLDGMFQALAQRYMKNNCACFTPNPGRVADVVRMAKEYKVDGVIDANLKFCTLYDVEKAPLADALAEEGIPCLGLETDYADNDAEQLRTRIGAGENVSAFLPKAAAEISAREKTLGRGPVLPEALESAILSRLRMLPQAAYNALPGASEGLGNSLYRAAHEEPTLDGVLAAAKSKRYALSRIRRMTMCAALGVTAGMDAGTPPYARVLAIGAQGRELLRAIDTCASVPVITKPAAGRNLPGAAGEIFALTADAHDLYVLGCPAREERRCGGDWRASPFVL